MPLQTPYQIAEETFVIPSYVNLPWGGRVYTNAMLIRAKEPVLIDAGTFLHREEMLRAIWSLIDPADLRWLYLTHDDRDHSSNILQVLEAAPAARLVTTFIGMNRLREEMVLPLDRVLWVNPEETLAVGDRSLVAVRPPLFDSPTTRGLFDPKTGVYFSVDCFGAIVPQPAEDISELPQGPYEEGFSFFNRANFPWHQWVDQNKFDQLVGRIDSLNATVIASSHAPAAKGQARRLCELLRPLPGMEPFKAPPHSKFDELLRKAVS